MILSKRFKSVGIFLLMLTVLAQAFFGNALSVHGQELPSDINGHWAESQIESWVENGWINGYPDGTFRPDNSITRAEFMALVNGAFGFTEKANINYSDINTGDWYYDAVSIATKAGYIGGYPDGTMRPTNPITRQEATIILSKVAGLTEAPQGANKFTDVEEIASWSKGYVGAVAEAGLMGGYPDGSFRPENNIKRAEAVVALDNCLTSVSEGIMPVVYDTPGVYGPTSGSQIIDGDVIITSKDVTLQNMIIEGNLTIDEKVGNGDVYTNNITVKGDTIVNGGGKDSVHFENSVLSNIIVDKKAGDVRIVALGNTTADVVTLDSPAKIEEINVQGSGFKNIVLSENITTNTTVTLIGNFQTVDVQASKVSVEIPAGYINELSVSETANNTIINVAEDTYITTAIIDAPVSITGEGTIEQAAINAESTLDIVPDAVLVEEGVVVVIDGTEGVGTGEIIILNPETPETPNNGGNNSGGSSGGNGGNNGGDNGGNQIVSVIDVTLNRDNVTLDIGKSISLVATITPSNATDKSIVWTSSDTNVATVNNGVVTARSSGTSIITVTTNDGNKMDICIVTVLEEEPVKPEEIVTIDNVNTNFNSTTGKVTVDGNISSGMGQQVTLRVFDPEGNIDYIGQTLSKVNGEFVFEFSLSSSLKGKYTVKLGGTKVLNPVETSFVY